jgi:hypothetical protein
MHFETLNLKPLRKRARWQLGVIFGKMSVRAREDTAIMLPKQLCMTLHDAQEMCSSVREPQREEEEERISRIDRIGKISCEKFGKSHTIESRQQANPDSHHGTP